VSFLRGLSHKPPSLIQVKAGAIDGPLFVTKSVPDGINLISIPLSLLYSFNLG
jgi:hypothetical protein